MYKRQICYLYYPDKWHKNGVCFYHLQVVKIFISDFKCIIFSSDHLDITCWIMLDYIKFDATKQNI